MWAPKLDESEALKAGANDFVEAIENKKKTLCDGRLGLRVIEIIEAATSSMKARGETIHLPRAERVL
jgi:predicted dehydrogenase